MLQNRVAYATGLHRIGICVSLSSRVYMLYATEQGCVRYGAPQSRDMCVTEQQGSCATKQGYVRDGAPQNKDMYVTEQQGLYVICYRTGLRTPRDSTEQGYVCHRAEFICHSSVVCTPQSRLRMPQVSTGH